MHFDYKFNIMNNDYGHIERIFKVNEEQRKAGTINILAERDRKAEKDYSKYFEQVYQPPSLKEAKKEKTRSSI